MLVDLNGLTCPTKVNRILHIFVHLRESNSLATSHSVNLALDDVKLLPSLFVELQAELLLTAHLLQLLKFSLLNSQSQLFEQALILNLSLYLGRRGSLRTLSCPFLSN